MQLEGVWYLLFLSFVLNGRPVDRIGGRGWRSESEKEEEEESAEKQITKEDRRLESPPSSPLPPP